MRTKPSLTLSDVKKILAACEAEAVGNGWAVAISVVDEGGYPLGFVRMDGAHLLTAETAHGKARTSALTRRPTKFFEELIRERPAFAGGGLGLLPVQGAVPILHQDDCIGAVGVSGAQSHEDELIALAGVAALD